jgi:hypothetical protein
MRRKLFLGLAAATLSLYQAASYGIMLTPFHPSSAGGTVNGQALTIGAHGSVFELDAYVGIGGQDLNGGFFGSTAQLRFDPLPPGLDLAFDAMLSDSNTDLTLSYALTNNTGAEILDLTFFSYLDADIGPAGLGEAAAAGGALGAGRGFEVDMPVGAFPEILDNLLLGRLDNANAVRPGAPGDVAMALSFALPALGLGDTSIFDIMISEDGDALGSFALVQTDAGFPDESITYSGAIRASNPSAAPAPATTALFALGLVGLSGVRRGRAGDRGKGRT